MPTPQDFIERAQFRANPETGQVEARLDGQLYEVEPFGDDAVQVCDLLTGAPVATLGFEDGKFVVPGHD